MIGLKFQVGSGGGVGVSFVMFNLWCCVFYFDLGFKENEQCIMVMLIFESVKGIFMIYKFLLLVIFEVEVNDERIFEYW